MNLIRAVIASLLFAAGLVGSAEIEAQSAPAPYTLQTDPEIPSTTTKEQQEEVMKLMTAYLGIWTAANHDPYPYERVLAEDVVFEYPYSEEEFAHHIEGRQAVAVALHKLPLEATDWKFSDVKLFETPHPDVFFVAYKARAYVPTTKRMYEQRFLARITVKDGKIANYYELWDRDARAAAFRIADQR